MILAYHACTLSLFHCQNNIERLKRSIRFAIIAVEGKEYEMRELSATFLKVVLKKEPQGPKRRKERANCDAIGITS